MTYDEFVEIAREETALLPSYVFEELDGGVVADPNVYLHPGRLSDDLYVMGTYSQGIYGSQIVLYYGSFQATMPFASTEQMRKKIRETVRHEFRHHLETRAGIFGKDSLIEEDREEMKKYYERRSKQT